MTTITAILIKSLCFLCAHTPENFLATFAKTVGHLIGAIPSRRRRTLLSNLSRAFPDWPRKRLLSVARKSAACLVEMGLFSLAYPCLSSDRIRRFLRIPPETERQLNELRRSGCPVVFFIPHVALFELLVASPHFRPGGSRSFGAVYRPNSNPVIDAWVLDGRQQRGLKMFARGTALIGAKGHLRRNNWLAVPFDQNAGKSGTLSIFLGRLASLTPLPGMLAVGTKAKPIYAITERTGFFRATLRLHEMKGDGGETLTTEAHALLESHLRSSDRACAEWLWAHGKWKAQAHPSSRLRLDAKRMNLPPSGRLPRNTKIWIRLPNWLGDVIMALPLLQALRKVRPDAELTILCRPQFLPLLELFRIGDVVKALPSKGTLSYYLKVLRWRRQYPDLHILFTNSLRGDMESCLIGSPQRFGLELPRKPRPLLTHTYKPPKEILNQLSSIHQTRLWERFLKHFGLESEISQKPFCLTGKTREPNKVGLIPGSSNNPTKCWPIEKWVQLGKEILANNPKKEIHLYGTQTDWETTCAISDRLPRGKIENRAGSTDLAQLAGELASCSLIISNDTGGIHLANALGTPAAVLYGPTNPLVTGPFFNSPKICIQPKGCSPEGGALMESLSVETVINGINELMKT